jgi:hypothetical protein
MRDIFRHTSRLTMMYCTGVFCVFTFELSLDYVNLYHRRFSMVYAAALFDRYGPNGGIRKVLKWPVSTLVDYLSFLIISSSCNQSFKFILYYGSL